MRRLTLLLALVLLTIPGWGQAVTASVQGTVDDEKGAVVPGAKVTLTSETTGISKTAQTDQTGRYQILFVDPGTYSVAVAATGFQPEKQTGVVVELFQARPVNFSLKVGGVKEQVVVNESVTPPLDTATSSMGQVVSQKLINDVPLIGRSAWDLAALTPGVNTTGNSSIPHIGGSRNLNNEQQIDGITNVLPEGHGGNNASVYTPILDSVQEVSVRTSVLPAEYGRYSGGVISLVTKSGSNQLHGSAFEFAQNSIFNAKDYFLPKGNPKLDSHNYRTGGTIGGPIIIPHLYNGRKRTFFFFGYQDLHTTPTTVVQTVVPLPAFLSGDFSQLGYPIYDPTIPTKRVGNDFVRTLMPGNGHQIPAARISQIGLNILNYFPAPNVDPAHWADPFNVQGPATLGYNHVDSGVAPSNGHNFDFRLDHDVMTRWHSFVHLSHGVNDSSPFRSLGENNIASPSAYDTHTSVWSASFNNIFTFTPTLFAEVRYGYATSDFSANPHFPKFDAGSLGFPAYYAQLANSQGGLFPKINFGASYLNNSLGTVGSLAIQTIHPTTHDVVASLVKIAGSHTLKFGGEYRWLNLVFLQNNAASGTFNAGKGLVQKYSNRPESQAEAKAAYGDVNLSSGDAVAELLLGWADGGQINHNIKADFTSPYVAFYAQDDWRVTRRLTLNLGLRWDYDLPRIEAKNRASYLDLTLPSPLGSVKDVSGVGDTVFPGGSCFACGNLKGQMVFVNTPGSKYGRRQAPIQWKDIAPRIGFAFSPNDHFVLRGGYGINFAPSAAQAAGSQSGRAGTEGFETTTLYQSVYDAQGTIVSPGIKDPFPNGFNLPRGVASGPLTDLTQYVYDSFDGIYYRNPYSQEWNLNFQTSLPGKLTIEAGYIGNHGLFLLDGDPGRPLDQVQTSYLSIGPALQNTVPNPFYGIITTQQFPNATAWAGSKINRYTLMRPYPQYGALIRTGGPGGASMYHAFSVRADKRFSTGLSFILSFTGSKLMDDSATSVVYAGPQSTTRADQYNPRLEWAVSPQDVSRTLVTGFTYELPFGPGRRFLHDTGGVTRFLISGWGSSGLVTYYTGNPVLIAPAPKDTTYLSSGVPQRPTWNGKSAKLSHPTPDKWFDTSVLSANPPFTIGNAPRTFANVRNPRSLNPNISFLKNNRWGSKENYNLQFRFDMFNIFNTPNFGPPSTSLVAPNYGKVTTASGARKAMLGLRFVF